MHLKRISKFSQSIPTQNKSSLKHKMKSRSREVREEEGFRSSVPKATGFTQEEVEAYLENQPKIEV